MKTTAELVMKYVDCVPVGEFITRKELLKFIYDNIIVNNPQKDNSIYVNSRYSTVDNYRNVLVHNNVLTMIDDQPGCYLKINQVPKDVSMTQLRDRMYTNPYYPTNKRGLLSWAKDLYN